MSSIKIVLFDLESALLYRPIQYSAFNPILEAHVDQQKIWDYILKYQRDIKYLFDDLYKTGLLQKKLNQYDITSGIIQSVSDGSLFADVMQTLQRLKELKYKLGVIGDVPEIFTRPSYTNDLYKKIDFSLFPFEIGMTFDTEDAFFEISSRTGYRYPQMCLVAGQDFLKNSAVKTKEIYTVEINRNNEITDFESISNLSEIINKVYCHTL